ncbi:hypothetical protein GOP47_0006350 [Adiantum capillus-veneris]|uniref:Box C/D snoRNA protein 1 n=1 Tax=Adiantum capillus-veneris TaxID=13818 RepID=A0A9D4V337_ADICA|nr:hypothetical protein GOP47_0006350 [Adiantum capillus-veneris]
MAEEAEERDGEKRAMAVGTVKCEECKKEVAKYKCPACFLRSCSLPCIRAHKERTSCSGKRDRTAFVPMDSFDDSQLLSDYQLLEEILRQSESARRFRAPFNTRKLEPYERLSILKREARRRRINLVILPRGMTKRVDNSTRYCKRRKCIFWRVEWHFHSTDFVLISSSADENESLAKVLERQLGSDGKLRADLVRKIRKFCMRPIEAMRLLVPKQMCRGKQTTYVELDPSEPLGAQLDRMTIIEYPIILVVSPDDDTKFTIIEDRRSKTAPMEVDAVTEKLLEDASVTEGVPYREEEIEEGEIVDD